MKTKVFFDTEFTGLRQDTSLISIGLISECGKTFYAENAEFDQSQLNDWLMENVLIYTGFYNDIKNDTFKYSKEMSFTGKNQTVLVHSSLDFIKKHLSIWFSQFEEVEIWSDCLAYDWVLFNNIFGTAFDIPKNVYYIPFDICTLFKIKNIDPDISREEFINNSVQGDKHNALYDAKVIKECYNKLIAL